MGLAFISNALIFFRTFQSVLRCRDLCYGTKMRKIIRKKTSKNLKADTGVPTYAAQVG
jgi:hypothetical protein